MRLGAKRRFAVRLGRWRFGTNREAATNQSQNSSKAKDVRWALVVSPQAGETRAKLTEPPTTLPRIRRDCFAR